MCGIAGYVQRDKSASREVLEAMGMAMRKRGPDDAGYLLDKNVGLVHRRLSIIDLEGGKNPVYNENESVCALLNGEIYNFRELRADLLKRGHVFRTESDTEVLVHLYEEHGRDFVHLLNGMFAFAIYDLKRRRLILARDRMGQKPLYFYQKNGMFAFASDLRCIEELPVTLTVDEQSIASFLRYQYIPAPLSIYREVEKLPQATGLEYVDGQLSTFRYWSLPIPCDSPPDRAAADHQEEFDELLSDSVKMRLVADVPIGAFLSGGLDSTAIVDLMCQHSQSTVKTFSIGFSDSSYDESANARLIARQLDTEHEELIIDAIAPDEVEDVLCEFGEPFADASALPTNYLCKMTGSKVKVALSGDGADELLGGYNRYRAGTMISKYLMFPKLVNTVPISALVSWLPETSAYYQNSVSKKLKHIARIADTMNTWPCVASSHMLTPSQMSEAMSVSRLEMDADPVYQRDLKASHLSSPEKMLYADLLSYMPDDILVKVDRMSMAHSLEVRSPFMDYRLVELVSRLPMSCKLHKGVSKTILRRSVAKRFPEAAVQRKHGFEAPVAFWLANQFKDRFMQLLELDLAPSTNSGYFKALLQQHVSGKKDHSKQLWPYFVLLSWLSKRKEILG